MHWGNLPICVPEHHEDLSDAKEIPCVLTAGGENFNTESVPVHQLHFKRTISGSLARIVMLLPSTPVVDVLEYDEVTIPIWFRDGVFIFQCGQSTQLSLRHWFENNAMMIISDMTSC